ncbi:unnamed protein product [Adineta steineri]|uniref:Ubiquitin-like domain-containing protein n=1 Tax=Adineta steineri TaxID=433720 RepID=A0A815QL19_9BILA|nr:unnamed protein product [Adineta steineri]CAF1463870.1 unnamed protein product [Adineta steineri]CAF1474485.1 unnamed protein product [Adineta steineri]CAF1636846.1 unnamed protein product [Adineta steineri]
MASSARSCAAIKCEIASCATCHCCQTDLCLDHLKEHKDRLSEKLIPLTNQINAVLDKVEHITPTSLPNLLMLEQWRNAAYQTIDQFCQLMKDELFEHAKTKSLEKLHTTRNTLDQLIRMQGATSENIDTLTKDIERIEQEFNDLQKISINLQPLVINKNTIIQSNSSSKSPQHPVKSIPKATSLKQQNELEALQNGIAFQIFVKGPTDEQILLAVKPSDTIIEVKHKIHDKTGMPIDEQRLRHMGKILKESSNSLIIKIFKQSSIGKYVAITIFIWLCNYMK